MGSHRRKWGWWLVAALAAVLAASLLLHRSPAGPSEVVPEADSTGVSVIRDTVYVTLDGDPVPIVRERPAEHAGESSSEAPSGEPASPAEMIITVPVGELAGLVREKSGRDIRLSTQAPDRLTVSYAGKVDIPLLGEQTVDYSAAFRIVEVKGDRLVLQLDNGAAMNVAADLAAPYILERLPEGLVESFSSGRAVVNLSAVPQLRKRLNGVELTGFSVDESGIQLKVTER